MRALTHIYSQSPRDLGNPDWIQFQNRKRVRTLKGEQNASVGQLGSPPTLVLGRPARSTGTNQEMAHISRSTAPVDHSFATVDRVVDRAIFVHVVHTG